MMIIMSLFSASRFKEAIFLFSFFCYTLEWIIFPRKYFHLQEDLIRDSLATSSLSIFLKNFSAIEHNEQSGLNYGIYIF